MSDCDHHWSASKLRVVIEDEKTALAAIIGVPPPLLPVEFCRWCGVLRLAPEIARQTAGT